MNAMPKQYTVIRVTVFILFTMLLFNIGCTCMQPRNTIRDCREQCKDSKKSKACYEFCNCIHLQGRSLDSCLDEYNKAPADSQESIK